VRMLSMIMLKVIATKIQHTGSQEKINKRDGKV